jgi:hypothetical protein
MSHLLLDPKRQYSFSDYFSLGIPVTKLVTYFGYGYEKVEQYTLPKSQLQLKAWEFLKQELRQNVRFTTLNSETARRESLIAPILFKIAVHLETLLEIEYPLRVNKQLGGKIDYYLQRENNLLIIEAKQGDLTRGFAQLAVELIAVDKWLEPDDKPLYGCVSMGNIWQFGILDRQRKLITEDMYIYQVPANLEELLSILIGILQGENDVTPAA